jgi:transposase
LSGIKCENYISHLMKTIKAYKFRLNPDNNILSILKQHGGNSRFLWNQLIEFNLKYNKENKKFPSQGMLQKEIIRIKNENAFLKTSHSQPLQVNAQRLVKTNIKSISPEMIAKRKKKNS